MRYRVDFILVVGFALFAGRATIGQAIATPENSAIVEQAAPAAASTPDSGAAVHWWQRFAPPAGAVEKVATPVAPATAPATPSAAPAPASRWPFGKLLKGNDKHVEQTDPFAGKAISYEEGASIPAVLVPESDAANLASLPPTSGTIPVYTPAANATNNTLVPVGGANGCPYPDTGLQSLYPSAPSAPGASVAGPPPSPVQPHSLENVHGAFDGLLGHDDVRKKQEAAALPILAPYKDLPVGPHTATAIPSVQQDRSGSPNNGAKLAAQPGKTAPPATDPRDDRYAVKSATISKEKAVVVAESTAPNQAPLTPPLTAASISSLPPAGGMIAANTPAANATNNVVVPVGGANGCPYPDTGIQSLYQTVPSAPGTLVTDRPTSQAPPQSAENVRGAFNGLLGHDDARTKQEAAAVPLLAPYKDLPVGFPPTATAQPGKTAPPATDPRDDRYAVKSATISKEKAIVDAAFNLPPVDTRSQTTTVQTPGSARSLVAAPNQYASPQPLQMNGVVAQQLTGTPLNRPKIIYHPGAGVVDNAGHNLMKPEVQVAADATGSGLPASVQLAQLAGPGEGMLPSPPNIAPEAAYPIDERQWSPEMSGFDNGSCENCQGNFIDRFMHESDNDCCRSHGIGAEYVAQAPFFIQTTQPFNNCYVRLDLARNLEFPDRSEYFWAKTPGGKGPQPTFIGERSVDYQDLDFYIEKGTKRLSIGTNLPIRAVDPELRNDTVGFADMSVKSKAVLIDGKNWQLTQLFNTYLPTGSAHHGTGDGHVSLEPGVAYRWKWSDITYFHGDLKYLFPIAADPDFSGQIFNYGFGWSHVLYETDAMALIPTLEFECWTFVDGRQTLPNAPVPVVPAGSEEINTIGIMNVCPGLRWVCDKGCDCGTKEFGISAGISVTQEHLYDQLLRLEFRWSR